ncbi:hypothetical protein IPM09_00675 [Candidatus Saccharibacteria bacterium]|nr:MAG: hypothetical protein IPM09_00675 [Candidatus Saccharibacteria bacterium]
MTQSITSLDSWNAMLSHGGQQLYPDGTTIAWAGRGTRLLKQVYDDLAGLPASPEKDLLAAKVDSVARHSASTCLAPALSPDFPSYDEYEAAFGTTPPPATSSTGSPFDAPPDLSAPANVGMVRSLGTALGELRADVDQLKAPSRSRGDGAVKRFVRFMNGR